MAPNADPSQEAPGCFVCLLFAWWQVESERAEKQRAFLDFISTFPTFSLSLGSWVVGGGWVGVAQKSDPN